MGLGGPQVLAEKNTFIYAATGDSRKESFSENRRRSNSFSFADRRNFSRRPQRHEAAYLGPAVLPARGVIPGLTTTTAEDANGHGVLRGKF